MTSEDNKLRSLWLELDHYQHFQTESAVDVTKISKLVKKKRIFGFFVGLNVKHDIVMSEIINKKLLPSIRPHNFWLADLNSRMGMDRGLDFERTSGLRLEG